MKKTPPPSLVFGGLVLFVILGVSASFLVEKRDTRMGMPAIGGSFTLTDHMGRKVTDADFRGKYLLIFFGYTFCPDVCPTTITAITEALDILPAEKAARITPVFVSVDSERDTPQVMQRYIANFHPSFVGLTGTREEIADVARKYRVYFARAKQEGGKDDGTYLIDHTAQIYLMGPDGGFVRQFPYGLSAKNLATRIETELN